jgi:Protein of unknown function (DUF3179)
VGCQTAIVYARKVGERTLTFSHPGFALDDALPLEDVETRTLWSQPTGFALLGEFAGRRLTLIPSVLTTFGEWIAGHPGTEFVWPTIDPALPLHPSVLNRAVAAIQPDQRVQSLVGIVVIGDERRAYSFRRMKERIVVLDTVDSVPMAFAVSSNPPLFAAYRLDVVSAPPVALELREAAGALELFEPRTGRRWLAASGAPRPSGAHPALVPLVVVPFARTRFERYFPDLESHDATRFGRARIASRPLKAPQH